MGTEQFEKIIDAAAEGINVGFQLFNKAGVFAIFQLSDELAALSSLNTAELDKEFKALDAVKQKYLNERFKSKLVLSDKVLEAKLESVGDCAIDAVKLVQEGISQGRLLYESGKSLYEKVRGIFG